MPGKNLSSQNDPRQQGRYSNGFWEAERVRNEELEWVLQQIAVGWILDLKCETNNPGCIFCNHWQWAGKSHKLPSANSLENFTFWSIKVYSFGCVYKSKPAKKNKKCLVLQYFFSVCKSTHRMVSSILQENTQHVYSTTFLFSLLLWNTYISQTMCMLCMYCLINFNDECLNISPSFIKFCVLSM